MSGQRGNGKTTALAERAILHAFTGRSVTFASFSNHSRTHAHKIVQDKLAAANRTPWQVVSHRHIQIQSLVGRTADIYFLTGDHMAAASGHHTNVLLLDDEHMMDPQVAQELKLIPADENGHQALIETYYSLRPPALATGWRSYPDTTKLDAIVTKKVCECGAAKINAPNHSNWCPLR